MSMQLFRQEAIDHQRFAIRHQGLDLRLTGVEPARVIAELLA